MAPFGDSIWNYNLDNFCDTLEPSCEPLHPDWTEAGAIIDSEKIAGKMHGSNLANMDENNDQKVSFRLQHDL
jgi:hypothetical protein